MGQGVELVGRQKLAQQQAQTAASGTQFQTADDVFSQIFMNIAAGTQENTEMLMQQAGEAQGQNGEQQNGEDYTGAMELMAMLFQGGVLPQLISAMGDTQQAQQLTQEMQMLLQSVQATQQATVQPAAILQQLEGGSLPQLKNLLTQMKEQPKEFAALMKTSGLSDEQAQSLQKLIQGTDMFTAVQTQTVQKTVDVQQLFQAYSERNALQNDVKEGLKTAQAQDGSDDDTVLDMDALQAQMNMRSNALNQQVKIGQLTAAQDAQPEEPIAKQVTQQMQMNLEKGSTEFTIRLRPENLGEITVKLVQKDGAMTLLLAADSENTKKLLNTNLEALREAVRPMQVEVREAVVQTQQADGENMSRQMDMSNGQFFNQQQAQQAQYQESHKRSNGADWQAWLNGEQQEEPATAQQAVQAAKVIAENLMDVYF